MFLKFAYGNVSQIIGSIFKKLQKACMKWKLANYISVIDESETFLKEPFGRSIEFPNEAGVFQLDAFPDLTAFIVLSGGPRVVKANFASTPNASAIASFPNTSTITTRAFRKFSRRALTCAKLFELTWTTMVSLQI